MSSLICFLRGDYRAVNQFITELSCKYLEFEYNSPDGKGGFIAGTKEKYFVPIGVRYLPLGAWEIVFPRQKKDLVLTTILGKKGSLESPTGKWNWMDKYRWTLRKMMKIDVVPDYDDSFFFPIFKIGIQVIPIGYKEDVINADGLENI